MLFLILLPLAFAHDVTVENHCEQAVMVGILSTNFPIPEDGGFVLNAGDKKTVKLVPKWSGRFWGRTGCDAQGHNCETGMCGGDGIHCQKTGGAPPVSLAEVTFDTTTGSLDFYDISLVDGYNLAMSMEPVASTVNIQRKDKYHCTNAGCETDLNKICPHKLKKFGHDGKTVVACMSACAAFNTDRFCCRGAFATPDKCPPFDESRIFKKACPRAYSYAYDDQSSTFTCPGKSHGSSAYVIRFCA